jgi:hypothetical protein
VIPRIPAHALAPTVFPEGNRREGKEGRAMQVQTIRRVSMVPIVVAAAVLIAAVGAIGLRSELASRHTVGTQAVAVGQGASAVEGEDWGFVLDSSVVQVLRHRPGLTPADVVRSHAFGWSGVTLHEAVSRPQYLRILRSEPTLSPLDLVRMEAQGS